MQILRHHSQVPNQWQNYFCVAAGALAGLVYAALAKKNTIVATVVAAIVEPIVNTGLFLVGCRLFFYETICSWAGSEAVGHYMIFGLVGVNFIIELVANLILSTAIVQIIKIGKKTVMTGK